jgi:beta-glucanase (GH16 family)
MNKKDARTRASWWSTFFMMFLGIAGAAVLCWRSLATVQMIPSNKLCSVLDENFDTLDRNTWSLDIQLGGFGNGEFQMTTSDPSNIYTNNGQLYIMPTLTSDILPAASIFDGGNYTLKDCTSTNKTACSVSSNAKTHAVINPVRSARLNTKNSASISFGKVEVRAKLPKGDWLWPAIWMLPVDDTKYGIWPMGGEIDVRVPFYFIFFPSPNF